MSQSLSRRSFLKCAGSGAVSLAAALLTGVSAAAAQPRVMGQPALLDGKAAVELLGYIGAYHNARFSGSPFLSSNQHYAIGTRL